MRQIILDTETTGLDPKAGERLIEIALLEMVDRKLTGTQMHLYFNPEKEVHPKAAEVHGFTWEKLKHFPTFGNYAHEIKQFIGESEIIIHNAPFDMGFLQAEMERHARWLHQERGLRLMFEQEIFTDIADEAEQRQLSEALLQSTIKAFQINNPVFCTLKFCRWRDKVGQYERGYKLEQQCEKFGIADNREKHSAIEDAKMLAQLYLKITEPFVGTY